MTIHRILRTLDQQEQHLLEVAYRLTLWRLGRVDRGDAVCELVAQKILEVSERETSNAIAISRLAMRELGVPEAGPQARSFVQTRLSKGD
jgi:hypothetical protein